jgi:protein-tyrosine phosphatase
MYKILDKLAVHGFNGDARITNLDTKYVDAEFGYIDGFKIIDVRMLNDLGNKKQDYDLNILRVTSELDEGNSVVVCCEAGQSRSNAIALGVLVRYFKMDFYDACELIKEKVPISQVDPSHIEIIENAIVPQKQ